MDGLDALKLLFNNKVKEKETGAVTITIAAIIMLIFECKKSLITNSNG